MVINLDIKNIIKRISCDNLIGVLYYSNDYDDFTILIVSFLDDVVRIYENLHISNLYRNSKYYAINVFSRICSNYDFGGAFIVD